MDASSIIKHKEIKTETIDITPDRSMMPKSGKVGYALTQAIAELVDNSIDARIPNKFLEIKIVLQSDFIKVEDNGSGMNRSEVHNSLILGHSDKKNQLGEFGIGMKAACTSLGKRFTVLTSKEGIIEGYLYKYDEDAWLSNKEKTSWKEPLNIFEKGSPIEHGTTIEIEGLRRLVSKARKPDILSDLGNRFAPFLLSNNVKIMVNNSECVPQQPELTSEGRKSFLITLKDNKAIHGWYGLLKRGSNKGFYGFNTFRRGRMITSYDKLGIPSHPTVSKIIGEIHMDNVPVSSNKRGWETESNEYTEAERLLKDEFKEIIAKARNSSLEEKLDKNTIDKTESWKAEIVKAAQSQINDLKEISGQIRRKKTEDSDDQVGEIIIERRDPSLEKIHQEIKIKEERAREPKKKQKIISHFITILGKNYTIKHAYAHIGEEKGWKDVYHKLNEPIEVYTNQDFPAYATTSDIPFYAAIHIAEAIGEIIAKANDEGLDKSMEYREKILRKAASMIDEFSS
jgi:hypothetical protein